MINKTISKLSIAGWLFMVITHLFFNTFPLNATNYYVDPVNGDKANDGSLEDPWKTLAEVFSTGLTFEAGDTIFLLTGHHGTVIITGINSDYVTILPLEGHQPTMKKVTFSNAKKWELFGVTISPETAPSYSRTTLLVINSSASEIVVDSCYVYSVEDNTPWSAADWVSNSCSGANISGDNNIIRNSHFLNMDHGIIVEVEGQDNLVKNNIIENFAGDGLRGIGNYNTFEYNTVKNCYDVDDNHDDGFQAYSRGPGGTPGEGTIYGIVLRGNTIISYTDPNQPFKGPLQGIGCFDGMFEDWIIENNVVITNHWHGITLLGAESCKIINNTVVDRNLQDSSTPWIKIGKHNDGTLGTGNLIRNNLTTSMSNDAGIGTVDYNIIVSNYDDFFVDYDNFDLRLIEGCPAIDAGSDEYAPLIDKEGISRPQGVGFDVGAYEFPSGPDSIPPAISSITSIKPNEVEVLFNERLDQTSAENAENYSIDHDVDVIGAVLSQNGKTVTLSVRNLVEEITYTLTVSNVNDAGGNVIESNSKITFEHICGYVTASNAQEPNYPENTLDGNLDTRWSAEGVQWIKYDLCMVHTISSVDMAFYYGDTRTSDFFLEVSLDNENWLEVFNGSSGGTTAGMESFDFPDVYGRCLKITGTGNSKNDWNSYTEVVINADKLIIDLSELSDSVVAANVLYHNAVEGSEPGEYSPGSKEIFKLAIDSAQSVLDNENATQAEISMVFAMLINAMDEFEENKLTGMFERMIPDIKIYPNPFNQQIHIELPDNIQIQKIYLIDILGQKLECHGNKYHTILDLEKLHPGIYILQLQTDKGVMNKRIVKSEKQKVKYE